MTIQTNTNMNKIRVPFLFILASCNVAIPAQNIFISIRDVDISLIFTAVKEDVFFEKKTTTFK